MDAAGLRDDVGALVDNAGDLALGDEALALDGASQAEGAMHRASLLVPLALVALAALVFVERDAVKTAILDLRAWNASLGPWSWVLFGSLYAVGVVLFVPGNVMTGLAVALFGTGPSIPLVSIAGTVGATVAFLVSRHCVRGHVARRLGASPRFRWLEQHTAERGALFVVVARVLPVLPGNILHYAFGLTRVSLGTFVFWSWLGSLPGLVMFVTGLTTLFAWSTGQAVSGRLLGVLLSVIAVKIALVAWAARQAGIPLRWPRARKAA